MRTFFFALLAIFFITCLHDKKEQIAQMQVIPGELPDPSIIEVNSTYYVCGSSNDWGPVYPIYQSEDLKNWTLINYVFMEPPVWTISSFWAPEIYFRDGTFYCYYTARGSDGISCIGVATADDITGDFTDHGPLVKWGDEAIDAFIYEDQGALYITWKAYGLTADKPIQILGSELTEDGLSLKGEAFEIVTAETGNWESGGIEGQCIVKHNEYLYMLYSGNACCGGGCNYQVGVARARAMKGPWEKFDGNPLLVGNDTWKCPGHGTALKTGGNWYYLYHAYNSKGFPYLGRSSLLSEVLWDQDTGWPYFDVNPGNIDPTVLKRDIFDDFSTGALQNWWHFDIPSYKVKTIVKDNQLTMIEESRARGNNTGAALCIVPEYADFTITTKVSAKNDALKGLIFYATSANSLGLGVKGDSLILWKVKDNQFIRLNAVGLDDTTDVYLRANISDAHIIDFHYSHDGNNWDQIENTGNSAGNVVGDNLAWWSWGMKAGLFVKADSISMDNKATFDEFVLKYH